MPTADACFVCGSNDFTPLPDPNPTQCMMSDFRIITQPLGKRMCVTCGAGNRPNSRFDFAGSYDLYAHGHGDPIEMRRQAAYAAWLHSTLPDVDSVYEAGSGNGSFLRALQTLRPSVSVAGVEPSPAAAKAGRDAGIALETGYVTAASPHTRVAIAINVIEHADDPSRFLADLASHSTDLVAMVCPDGEIPHVELLMADHISSFTRANVRELMHACGLAVVAQYDAPGEIGAFFLTIASRGAGAARYSAPEAPAVRALKTKRTEYLNAWREIDDRLLERLRPFESVAAFGAGEAAALLRAYAPRSWQRVRACYVDRPSNELFGDVPVYEAANDLPKTLLLGLRPQSQQHVAQRLAALGITTIRWDDLIAA